MTRLHMKIERRPKWGMMRYCNEYVSPVWGMITDSGWAGDLYRRKAADESQGIIDNSHVESLGVGEASLGHEIGGLRAERVATQCLNGVDSHDDECPSKIDTPEAR